MSSRSIVLACAVGAVSAAGVAQTLDADSAASAPAAAELAPVSVTAVRDPAMLPYAKIGPFLRGLEQHGQGLFRMDFKLAAKDPAKPIVAPITLTLQQGDHEQPIPITANRRFTLPVLSAEDAKDAALASNQPKATFILQVSIALTTPPAALDLGTVRRIVATAGTLRGELLPWYVRWMFPKVNAVRICSRRAAWAMQWAENGQLFTVTLPADPAKHDETDTGDDTDDKAAKSRVCTSLSGQEPWPESARLVADADTTLSMEWNR